MRNGLILIDENEHVREVIQECLEQRGYEPMPIATVAEALRHISAEDADVLSEMHDLDASEKITVVRAVRHSYPGQVTVVLKSFQALHGTMEAILPHADEVHVNSIAPDRIHELVDSKLSNPGTRLAVLAITKERIAITLERNESLIWRRWMSLVGSNEELRAAGLEFDDCVGHALPLLSDLICRLHFSGKSADFLSDVAREHGILRRDQGYTIAMVVEEFRILHSSIFQTLQGNLAGMDSNTLLLDVMTIADETTLQLKQCCIGYAEG
jgi:ActR/RegA family two-component response regulator